MTDDIVQRYAQTAGKRLRNISPRPDITDLWRDLAIILLQRAGETRDFSKTSHEELNALMVEYRCTFTEFQNLAERAVRWPSLRPTSSEGSSPSIRVPPTYTLPEFDSEYPPPLPDPDPP